VKPLQPALYFPIFTLDSMGQRPPRMPPARRTSPLNYPLWRPPGAGRLLYFATKFRQPNAGQDTISSAVMLDLHVAPKSRREALISLWVHTVCF
jgi:hypothetical protein